MSQGPANLNVLSNEIKFADSPAIDAFGRLRVASPVGGIFDAQFTNDLHPLLFEQITSGAGATITYDATNRRALMTFSSTPTGGSAYMQTYQYARYQPGKSQFVAITFTMGAGTTDVTKFAGYSDGVNGIEFAMVGTTPTMRIFSSTSNGNQSVAQSSWNLDKFDGTGASGLIFDPTKVQIFILDFQALYSGRVRVGFSVGGREYYVHQFVHSNSITAPYIANANLPIRAGMTCTGTVSDTMYFNCCTIISEGGQEITAGYEFATIVSGTAGNDVNAHILSVRPKTTFNGIANRALMSLIEIDVLVTGSNHVIWSLVLGQAISGTTTFTDVNTTYSCMEYNSAGTISGSPAVIIDSGFVAATNQTKTATSYGLTTKYPITLNQAGAVRALGTVSLIATGLTGTSTIRASLKWKEVR